MCVGGGGGGWGGGGRGEGGRDWGNTLKLKLSLMSDLTSIFFSGPPTQPENLLKLRWNCKENLYFSAHLTHVNSVNVCWHSRFQSVSGLHYH